MNDQTAQTLVDANKSGEIAKPAGTYTPHEAASRYQEHPRALPAYEWGRGSDGEPAMVPRTNLTLLEKLVVRSGFMKAPAPAPVKRGRGRPRKADVTPAQVQS